MKIKELISEIVDYDNKFDDEVFLEVNGDYFDFKIYSPSWNSAELRLKIEDSDKVVLLDKDEYERLLEIEGEYEELLNEVKCD